MKMRKPVIRGKDLGPAKRSWAKRLFLRSHRFGMSPVLERGHIERERYLGVSETDPLYQRICTFLKVRKGDILKIAPELLEPGAFTLRPPTFPISEIYITVENPQGKERKVFLLDTTDKKLFPSLASRLMEAIDRKAILLERGEKEAMRDIFSFTYAGTLHRLVRQGVSVSEGNKVILPRKEVKELAETMHMGLELMGIELERMQSQLAPGKQILISKN